MLRAAPPLIRAAVVAASRPFILTRLISTAAPSPPLINLGRSLLRTPSHPSLRCFGFRARRGFATSKESDVDKLIDEFAAEFEDYDGSLSDLDSDDDFVEDDSIDKHDDDDDDDDDDE